MLNVFIVLKPSFRGPNKSHVDKSGKLPNEVGKNKTLRQDSIGSNHRYS